MNFKSKIMKKLLLMLAVVIGFATVACAGDTYSRNVSDLPTAAQSLLSKHFKAKMSLVKIDKNAFGSISDYEVILTDGTEVEFDKHGNWEKVETANNKEVPSSLIPQNIRNYVKKNHGGMHVVGIEKDRRKYDVELSNGIDMEFSLAGDFLRYD